MRALTVVEPYASLIAYGRKITENRTWTTKYRGLLAIHAGKSKSRVKEQHIAGAGDLRLTFGAIVAVVWLEDVFQPIPPRYPGHHYPTAPGWAVARFPDLEREPWRSHVEGPYCWLLTQVVRLKTPIVVDGWRRLWEVSKEHEAAMRDQVWESKWPRDRLDEWKP